MTIGKGFAGTIKRHHFSSNRASHGNSVSNNVPGSIGNGAGSGPRVPGQAHGGPPGRRAAHDAEPRRRPHRCERGLLLVRGAVPGAEGGHVIVRPAVKAKAPKA